MIGYIYMYTSPEGKLYIGQTIRTIEKRAGGGSNYLRKTSFHDAISKFGFSNMVMTVLEVPEADTREGLVDKLNEREEWWIRKYNTTDRSFGYNHLPGGLNRRIVSEETRRKMSAAAKLRVGDKNAMYGKKHSAAFKLDRSINNPAKRPEVRVAISEGHRRRREAGLTIKGDNNERIRIRGE